MLAMVICLYSGIKCNSVLPRYRLQQNLPIVQDTEQKPRNYMLSSAKVSLVYKLTLTVLYY